MQFHGKTRTMMRTMFGSHLYGTSTPASDLDFKSIFIPDVESILLQRVPRSISTKREKFVGEKNVAGEVDEEAYSLSHYLKLVMEGQTVALDMLFTPAWAMTDEPTWEWNELVDNHDKLVTKKTTAFVGYCRQQAAKYGIKGSRVAAVQYALKLLGSAACDTAKLGTLSQAIENTDIEHISIVQLPQPALPPRMIEFIPAWEVCNRKMPYTITIRAAEEIMQRLMGEYGHRAMAAKNNEGVDWKACSHAIRVGTQAIELLESGKITFPLWNRDHLIKVKLGDVPYQTVAEEIEGLVDDVTHAAEKSALPNEPDRNWIENFIAEQHYFSVLAG